MQRVTNYQQSRQFTNSLHEIQTKLAQTNRRLATGRQINSPHENPVGTAQAMKLDAQIGELKQFQRNVQFAGNFVSASDDALNRAGEYLHRVRELAVQGATATADPQARATIAAELASLKQQLMQVGNTKHNGQYIFSGTDTDTPAYATNTYGGDPTGTINRRISPGVTVALNVNGQQVFGASTGVTYATQNTFDMIDQLVTDLTSGVAADVEDVRLNGISAVDTALGRVLNQRANLGATAKRLDSTGERLKDMTLRLTEARSRLVDADLAQTYSDLQTQNTMYQSALASGARLTQTSLLDFLR